MHDTESGYEYAVILENFACKYFVSLFCPARASDTLREARLTRNYVWRLREFDGRVVIPFTLFFSVSGFIFLTIQFPSRRRSRKLFRLRRLGTESIFHVISAIAGNFNFLHRAPAVLPCARSFAQTKINISF